MGKIIAVAAAVVLIAAGFFLLDVEQTEEGTLPDVDVSVEGGQAPEFKVETGDAEVGETTVTVPTIEVTPAED
ncbi:hypothetical protein [Oceanibium sediminis]|uniref:hypothetical protein n=1 Tax=Oceanibium sediminis TaxID=2026339 RepID=UPI000DD47DDD|nr:hypothetical protein [Oceanibium sediminis]